MRMKTALLAGASVLAMTAHAYADPGTLGSLIISAFLSVGAGGLLPVASASAIGLGALGLAGAAANVALSFLGRPPSADPQTIKNTSKGAEGPGRYAFGRVELAGRVAFGNTAGYNIYRLLLHCFGPLVAAEEYFYDGRAITVEANGDVSSPPFARPTGSFLNVSTKKGDGSETAWPALLSDFPELWTADHRVRGIAQTLLRALNPGTGDKKFATLYQGGIKELKVRGRVGEFYDPRDASTKWTINGVLHVLHFLRMLPGMTDSVIDFEDIATTAAAAEQVVSTLTGTAPRCQLSGGWEGPLTTDIVLDMLESAGLEVRTTSDGKYTLSFIEDDPEPEITLYSRHIIDRDYKSGPDGAKRPNICTLSYFSPERRYEVAEIDLTNAPWAKVQDEIDRYGDQENPVKLIFCCDASQAQRIARQLFHMARADAGVIKTTFAGLAAWGKRTALIEFPDVGDDGASVFLKCRLGPVRPNDDDGTCEIPFQVIPDILKTPWNPALDEVAPPPVLETLEYESDLDKPATPVAASVVQLPDASYETRVKFSGVSGGTTAEAVYRTYLASDPTPFASMAEYQGGANWYGYVAANTAGKKADFKVRFFNGDDEGSYYSDLLTVDPLSIDNTTPAAPVMAVSSEFNSSTGKYDIDIAVSTSEMHVARLSLEQFMQIPEPGHWSEIMTSHGRPEEPITFSLSANPVPEFRAFAYTSNGTQSPATSYP